jgi:hypothetical protein
MCTASAVPAERTQAVSNLRKVMLFGALLGGYAWAAEPTGTGLDNCPKIVGDKERLPCFDREVALLAQRAPAPAAAAKPAAPNTPGSGELTPEQAVGLPPGKILKLQKSPTGTEIKALDAKIERVSVNSSGREVFKLNNGQVWQQVESDPKFVVQPGDTVHLTKALLGSFFMAASKKMSTRVSRIE